MSLIQALRIMISRINEGFRNMRRGKISSEIVMFLKRVLTVQIALISIGAFARNPFQNCLDLNGVDNYVRIQSPIAIDSSGLYTIEFWAKANSMKPGNLINKWVSVRNENNYNASNQGWSIDVNTAGGYVYDSSNMLAGWSEPGAIRLITSFTNPDGSGGDKSNGAVGVFEVGRWYHFSVVLSRQNILVYVNGDNTYQGGRNQAAIGYPLFVGGYPSGIDSTLYLDGCIDELRIWNRARTKEQLIVTMRDTLGVNYYSSPDSGLVGYYRFDQFESLGVGGDDLTDDVRDLSVYANHADVVGAPTLTESTIEAAEFTLADYQGFPKTLIILRNYPNPFNPSTTIRFELQSSQAVGLKVFNTLGVELETLLEGTLPRGAHEVTWNAANRSDGMYFCRLETGRQSKTIKMLLQK
jgi:hypothetical protein